MSGEPDYPALIRQYQHRLYGYLFRMTGEPAAAEDLFQQTWLRAVERADRYDPRRGFDAWLFAIAHNLAVDYLRGRRTETLDPDADPADADAPGSLDVLLAGERAEMLAAAVAELPPLWRETLALRFEEDMKLEEIAATVGAPLPTVKSRLRRALARLRARLAPAPEETAPPKGGTDERA
jgi:RNA polymerase sigma-70 factor (ECF subfamily)